MLKIDIEGAEYFALCGMNQLLLSEKKPRFIFIEIHPLFLEEINISVDDVIGVLESCGYICESKKCRDDEMHCVFIKNL